MRLNLIDLLNVAQIYHPFATFAPDVYHHKYSNMQVVLTDNFPFPAKVNDILTGAMKIDADILERISSVSSFVLNKRPDIKEYKYEIEFSDYDGILNTFMHLDISLRD